MKDYLVTVCAECLTASCWHGVFMCQQSAGADIKTLRASDLRALDREHPSHYSTAALVRVYGSAPREAA